jgi:hypothetical protein
MPLNSPGKHIPGFEYHATVTLFSRRDWHFGKQRSRNIGARFVALGAETDIPENYLSQAFVALY